LNILDKIIEVKKEEVKKLHKDFSVSRFKDSKFFEQRSLSLINEINSDNNISIIAEIKKASPSKGILREDFNHLKIAETYFENDVNAISILTDENFFKGNLNYLREIAEFKIKPLLRKDFIIDEFQIYEAKANGADVILLISEALSKNQIQEFTIAANEIGLEVLLELHSEIQFEKINFDLNKLIGINNRNLENFVTDIQTTIELSKKIPDEVLIVSESGIEKKENLELLKETKTSAILVGEYFMKSKNIKESLKQIKDWCRIES